VRKLKDMKDRYKDSSGIRGNLIIYNVYIRNLDNFELGLTVINPGNINGEYFMTKGHRHKKKSEEIYILRKGKGKLLLEGKKSQIVDMKNGEIYIIPGNSGHRLINTGNKKMEVLTVYNRNAGHDYNFKFRRRVLKKR